MSQHEQITRDSFERQRGLFEGEDAPFARRANAVTAWLEPLDPGATIVLDVACGAAHVSEQVAPFVRQVVGIDVTPALLESGSARIAAAGIGNVLLQRANVALLPFVDASFDLVVCRTAVHHFPDREQALAEMRRVCRPDGRVVIADMVAPSAEVRERFDAVHRVIDPSHVSCLLGDELVALVASRIGPVSRADAPEPLQLPADLILTDAGDPDAARAALLEEIDGGPPTGLEPSVGDDGTLSITVHFTTVEARPAA
jgi:SAM-dependent methyltransferase